MNPNNLPESVRSNLESIAAEIAQARAQSPLFPRFVSARCAIHCVRHYCQT